jgi:GMP synthase (glutamine-hydrolysing)
MTSDPHVLVLQHTACEGPGRIAAALAAREIAARVARIDRGDAVPPELGDARGLVVMGGPMGVYEADCLPHLAAEMRLIERAVAAGTPVLGVCLGSQLVAGALGANVRFSGQRELGWLPVMLDDAASSDPLFTGVPRTFRALHWHGDIFDLPAGATHLAASAMTAHLAFRLGRAWGILFHIELDLAQVAEMADVFASDLADAAIDRTALIAESRARLAEVAPIADAIFGHWAELVGESITRP